jgi:preprotein translocase subunit SecE
MTESTDQPIEQEQDQVPVSTLGVDRWVQFTFLAGAAVGIMVFEKIIFAIWEIFDEPQPNIVLAAGVVASTLLAFFLYARQDVRRFVRAVFDELMKTTWPTREQAWGHTITVLAVSVIAAVIVGVFDAVWSTASDYLYKL